MLYEKSLPGGKCIYIIIISGRFPLRTRTAGTVVGWQWEGDRQLSQECQISLETVSHQKWIKEDGKKENKYFSVTKHREIGSSTLHNLWHCASRLLLPPVWLTRVASPPGQWMQTVLYWINNVPIRVTFICRILASHAHHAAYTKVNWVRGIMPEIPQRLSDGSQQNVQSFGRPNLWI